MLDEIAGTAGICDVMIVEFGRSALFKGYFKLLSYGIHCGHGNSMFFSLWFSFCPAFAVTCCIFLISQLEKTKKAVGRCQMCSEAPLNICSFFLHKLCIYM